MSPAEDLGTMDMVSQDMDGEDASMDIPTIEDMEPAIDVCDGVDNDGDGTTDAITCTGSCPQTGVGPDGSIGFCEQGVCVYKPANQGPPGCDVALACMGAAGYEPVPEACKF